MKQEKPSLSAVLEQVVADELVDLFVALTSISSPSGAEREVADFILAYLRALGLEPWEDDTGSVIGGDAGNIMCCVQADAEDVPIIVLGAHMDTVPPDGPIVPVLSGGVFRNDAGGILGADDKTAVAALLCATKAMVTCHERLPAYELLFTVSEETALTGVKHLDQEKIKSRLGVVLDSAGPVGGIVVAAPSQNTIRATFRGEAAHAGVEPERGRNAVWAAGKALAHMTLGRLDEETTTNMGLIRGGTARNIVPAECFLEGEARSHNETKLAAATGALVDAIQLGAAETGVDVDVEVVTEYRGYHLNARSSAVRLAKRAVKEIGVQSRVEVAGGGADANVLNERGLPTVNLTTGMKDMHSAYESQPLRELERLTHLVTALVRLAPDYTSRGAGRKG
ncbi:MAG: M20/M25/M40 family metallo-hydrolase [Actinobacteria bacterium]|nr:M20/M25/M40 family metallo-hydrolase [Actinomycetota bacterium]